MVKFQRHAVVCTSSKERARVFYSLDNRIDGRKCVTMYAKDHDGALGRILGNAYTNDSDSMTDYFTTGKAVLFDDHPLYTQARAAVAAFL